MSHGSHEKDRRAGRERRGEDRRKRSVPVAIERRSGGDRRVMDERRAESKPR